MGLLGGAMGILVGAVLLVLAMAGVLDWSVTLMHGAVRQLPLDVTFRQCVGMVLFAGVIGSAFSGSSRTTVTRTARD